MAKSKVTGPLLRLLLNRHPAAHTLIFAFIPASRNRPGVHLDSDHHPITGWQRAANAVLYVNDTWQRDWGGAFELWDAEGETRLESIVPRFNRLVLFEPSDVAFHAVTEVVGPEMRKTLTVFFWKRTTGNQRRLHAEFILGA